MTQLPEKRSKSSTILIELPYSRFLISHIDNIHYSITKLREYSKNNGRDFVIGYYGERSAMGDREILHQILTLEEAKKRQEEAKEKDIIFEYVTLEDLLLRIKEVMGDPHYRINKGYITYIHHV